ncbi:metal-dependent transcriptional regulator [Pseudonocardia sp. N23]|uniref:metal-dependent transcriptional regulator n=1 Tax=Pseudonocardia sp. N23 TaxID=1987376 RepID=UPI000BFBC87D|nr:metal-dependent transcriptional regulator [Pseudonocardia sp. N23]GAY10430.1 Mn-dependent transcriptional regulator MntR [Pseudonocardia sp. N23]
MTESAATENYLKVLWTAREWSDEPVTVSALAARLGLAASSVSEVVRRLTERGLVAHARYRTIELTDEGRRIALATVRKHRLIETFLVEYLGYGWDEVHDEADVLEHAVSDVFVDRLALRLGEPDRDPHGDPIPHADGSMPGGDELTLDSAGEGSRVRVVRVSDNDPQILRHLDRLGIALGSVLEVVEHHDTAGTIGIVNDGADVVLGVPAARLIRVEAIH